MITRRWDSRYIINTFKRAEQRGFYLPDLGKGVGGCLWETGHS
jgi:hypothetical protein